MKKVFFLIGLILIIFLIFCLIPVKKKNFLDLYQKKDPIRDGYIFIKSQPLKNLVINNKE